MQLYEPWIEFVKEKEKFSATPYRCPAGIWTIGYGHTGPDVTERTLRITPEQGLAFLGLDMGEALAQAFELSPNLYVEGFKRQAAIGDFCFNCGPVAYAKSTLRKRVNGQQWALAALENAKWVHAKGKRLAGLVKRRATTSLWLKEG